MILAIALSGFYAICPGINCPVAETYDETPVGKAMQICLAHSHAPAAVYPENPSATPIEYDDGWEDCNAVRAKWNKTKAAKDELERIRKQKEDRDFVRSIAKKPEN